MFSYQYQEPSNDDYSVLKNHHPKQTLVVYNHLATPMAPALGHPNRSCASCKKRKVKCDRKTPSCTACQKSRYKCLYTSYSPPVFAGSEPQIVNDDDRRPNEKFLRLIAASIQPNIVPKQQESYYEDYNNFSPMVTPPHSKNILPTTPVEHQHPHLSPRQQQFSPPPAYHQNQNQVHQEFYQSPSPTYTMPSPPQYHHVQHPQHAHSQSPFMTQNVMVQQATGSYVPYMKANVTLNYNLSGMNLLLGPAILPYIQAITNNNNSIPQNGFIDIADLQEWLKRKFMDQEWNDETDSTCVVDPDEKFYVLEQSNQNVTQQKFTVLLYKPEYTSSPVSSCNDDFEHGRFGGEEENADIDSHVSYASSRGSSRSSMVLEVDHTDVFLDKVYTFVRRFIKNVPWLKENLALQFNLRSRGYTGYTEAAFSDVVVDVRKNNPMPLSPYANRKYNHNNNVPVTFHQQNPEETVAKGRMFI